MADRDYSPYQQKIIKRYYNNFDGIKQQRLADLVTDLYLAEGKKKERLWAQAAQILVDLEFPQSRIDHLLIKKDPALLAGVLQEIQARPETPGDGGKGKPPGHSRS